MRKIREKKFGRVNLTPVILFISSPLAVMAYINACKGDMIHSFIAFTGLYMAGFIPLVLKYKNSVTLSTQSITFNTLLSNGKIEYQNITGVHIRQGLLDILALGVGVEIVDKNGKSYRLFGLQDGHQLFARVGDEIRKRIDKAFLVEK